MAWCEAFLVRVVWFASIEDAGRLGPTFDERLGRKTPD